VDALMSKNSFEHSKHRQRTGGAGGARISRFRPAEIEAERSIGLRPNHPALSEGRTIFRKSVKRVADSPRLLVSGANNSKLGRKVLKGPWAGRPIYQLSLEERATCPRSCQLWSSCYGNAMHLARRHDHTDPAFLPALRAELEALNHAHRKGFVVRLHTLGDFYSVEYVRFWADMLDTLDGLYVFGFTHRREDADDDESRRIARALRYLSETAWSVFALRFSNREGAAGTVTVTQPSTAPDVVMCPAQTHQTEACATCGLCWAPAARNKRIGFLQHGMKRPTRRGRGDKRDESIKERDAAIRARYETPMSAREAGLPYDMGPGQAMRSIIKAGGRLRSRTEAQGLRRQKQAGPV